MFSHPLRISRIIFKNVSSSKLFMSSMSFSFLAPATVFSRLRFVLDCDYIIAQYANNVNRNNAQNANENIVQFAYCIIKIKIHLTLFAFCAIINTGRFQLTHSRGVRLGLYYHSPSFLSFQLTHSRGVRPPICQQTNRRQKCVMKYGRIFTEHEVIQN